MSILIAEDNVAQRTYLRDILERDFPLHKPVLEAGDGEETVTLALKNKPDVCILDIQMPKLSGVKAARAIWRDFPKARIIFWSQFPHEIYINEIRKIVKSVDPPPAYGFIHKNNPESRFLRFVAAVLEDGADMIDPAFKDSFKRPLLTEFEAEALSPSATARALRKAVGPPDLIWQDAPHHLTDRRLDVLGGIG